MTNRGLISQEDQPILMDYYELTMAYAYWVSGRHTEIATFEIFFRKCPFGGSYVIFAGLEDCIEHIMNFRISDKVAAWLKSELLTDAADEFFEYLKSIRMDDVTVVAVDEGSPVFPHVPLMQLTGPLVKLQLLETVLLNAVGFASLVATNACRFTLAAGGKSVVENGAHSAHGPNGALSASRFAYIGGCDTTTNVIAAKHFGIPLSTAINHAFVMSFRDLSDLAAQKPLMLASNNNETPSIQTNFKDLCIRTRNSLPAKLGLEIGRCNDGEFAAMISFAAVNPNNFLVPIDTYNPYRSGLQNFLAVAIALSELGYEVVGVQISGGDIQYLSGLARELFRRVGVFYEGFDRLQIWVQSDFSEESLSTIRKQAEQVDVYVVGSRLVTCSKHAALGCVYKLVQLNEVSTIKVSEDPEKMTLPGRKNAYRCYGEDAIGICDYLTRFDEPPPREGVEILIRHPSCVSKRAKVVPKRVENLLKTYIEQGKLTRTIPRIEELRRRVKQNLEHVREDHLRTFSSVAYKVSLSASLHENTYALWNSLTPVFVLK